MHLVIFVSFFIWAVRMFTLQYLQIAVDRAAPLDETRSGLNPSNALFGGAGGPLRGSSSIISGSAYGNTPANLAFNSGVSLFSYL